MLPIFSFSQILFDWSNVNYFTHTNGSTGISQTIDDLTIYAYHTHPDGDLKLENGYITSDVTTSSNMIFIEFSNPANVKTIRLLSKDGSDARVNTEYFRENGSSMGNGVIGGFTDFTYNVNSSFGQGVLEIKQIELDFERDNWAIGEIEVISYALDVKELDNYKINIYPNPVSNILNIKTNSNIINNHYVIFDVLGQAILNGEINNNDSVIDVNNLVNGLYLIKIGDNITHKFIKQ